MQPTLNPQVLHDLQAIRLDDGNNLAYKLVTIFLDVTPSLLDALHSAYLTGDTRTTARLISRLRGSSSCVGALRFADLCGELERLQTPDRSTISRRLEQVRDEYSRVEYELGNYMQLRYVRSYAI